MVAAIGIELDERLHRRRRFVADAQLCAVLIEIAVVVAGAGAVGEHRVLVGGAVDPALDGDIEPVEALAHADAAADVGGDRQPGEAGLDVRAARIVGATRRRLSRSMRESLVTSMRPLILPSKAGRSRLGAVP